MQTEGDKRKSIINKGGKYTIKIYNRRYNKLSILIHSLYENDFKYW